MPVYQFEMEFTVRAASKDEAENEVKEELGQDVFENHITCKEIEDKNQSVDIELLHNGKVAIYH